MAQLPLHIVRWSQPPRQETIIMGDWSPPAAASKVLPAGSRNVRVHICWESARAQLGQMNDDVASSSPREVSFVVVVKSLLLIFAHT